MRLGNALKAPAQQGRIGQHFGDQVGERADTATDEDDPQPVPVRTPAHEVDEGERLEDDAVGIEEAKHAAAATIYAAPASQKPGGASRFGSLRFEE